MMESVKVVVHCKDGRVVKGFTHDFNPTHPSFHLNVGTSDSSHDPSILMELKEIKAVFFVKTFEGDNKYSERNTFIQGDRVQGRKVEVTFIDNEVIRGSTVGYDPQRLGYFLIPIDPKSNNIRIFVVSKAVKNFRFL